LVRRLDLFPDRPLSPVAGFVELGEFRVGRDLCDFDILDGPAVNNDSTTSNGEKAEIRERF
jgi:hypothetical protein